MKDVLDAGEENTSSLHDGIQWIKDSEAPIHERGRESPSMTRLFNGDPNNPDQRRALCFFPCAGANMERLGDAVR